MRWFTVLERSIPAAIPDWALASAGYNGQIDGALTELSYYWTMDQSRFVPKAAFEYVHASTGSFQEMGGLDPVAASGATLERSRMLVGAEIGHYWIVDQKILDLSAYGKFVDNFEQNLSSVTVSLGPESISVQGIGESRYGADAGAALSRRWRHARQPDQRPGNGFDPAAREKRYDAITRRLKELHAANLERALRLSFAEAMAQMGGREQSARGLLLEGPVRRTRDVRRTGGPDRDHASIRPQSALRSRDPAAASSGDVVRPSPAGRSEPFPRRTRRPEQILDLSGVGENPAAPAGDRPANSCAFGLSRSDSDHSAETPRAQTAAKMARNFSALAPLAEPSLFPRPRRFRKGAAPKAPHARKRAEGVPHRGRANYPRIA